MKKSAIFKLTRELESQGVPQKDQKSVVQYTLAMHVAWGATLPSSPVTSARVFYAEQVRDQVMDKISQLNEAYVINVPSTMRLAENFWHSRYQALFEPQSAAALALSRSVTFSDAQHGATKGMADVATKLSQDTASACAYFMKQIFNEEG